MCSKMIRAYLLMSLLLCACTAKSKPPVYTPIARAPAFQLQQKSEIFGMRCNDESDESGRMTTALETLSQWRRMNGAKLVLRIPAGVCHIQHTVELPSLSSIQGDSWQTTTLYTFGLPPGEPLFHCRP